ncbi:lipocalin-like protein [Winogradskyella epiphytica]|uniref:Lipocalin-like protein n=1 Tax=Winogradskyella epiphytica TaxID=262005 RepID=A0A2V4X735_9FLAO|nr:hypothetical protein [Winogradskyella epiphytica]PYE81129.1 lipocalin-like protein [Winogradskyella epiphytica]GGW67044.1 hypothetical protein GCM10008085_18710 [Winogradskyella epiphytica]
MMLSKIQNLFAIALIMCLSSCSSDDDSSDSMTELHGTWSVVSLSIETAFDLNNDGVASRNLVEETPCYNGDYVNFNSDGDVRVVTALTDISVNVNSSTDYNYTYECLPGIDQESTWTRNENVVTITMLGYTLSGTISGNTMTVVIPNFFQIQKYDGNAYYEVEEDVTVVYIKA